MLPHMTRQVTIRCGSRLHWGLLAVAPQAGRRFGGIGLMIERPGLHLRAEALPQGTHDELLASERQVPRLREFLDRYRTVAGSTGPVRLALLEEIPPHAGFGSGTQLGLAVALALSRLDGSDLESEGHLTASQLAIRAGRGARSAIGLHGFLHGGFIVDAGIAPGETHGALAVRTEWPADWRVVLVCPPAHGLSGSAEQQAFAALAPMPTALTDQLCRLIVMELLPAIEQQQVQTAARAIALFGQLVGQYFAPVQGGVFAHALAPRIDRIVQEVLGSGVAQTSWGPTVSALCESDAAAQQVVSAISADPLLATCTTLVTPARNTGASID